MTDHEKDDEAHRRVEELLPWRLTDRLSPEERAEVDAALDRDPALREELRFLEGVRDEVVARDVTNSPGDFGLARLRRAVSEEQDAARTPNASTVTEMPSRTGRVWRYAAIAACVLVAVQTAGILINPEMVMRLAGGSIEVRRGPVLVVAFRPETTEAEIRALLLDLDLTIVDGPSALGLYRVAAADETAASRAIVALGGATKVVESVERE